MWHVSRIIHFLIWKETFISDNYSTIYGFFVHFKVCNKSQLSCWRTIFKHSFIWICCIFSSMWKFSAFTLFMYKSWQLSTWTFPMVWIFFPLHCGPDLWESFFNFLGLLHLEIGKHLGFDIVVVKWLKKWPKIGRNGILWVKARAIFSNLV